MLGEFHFYLCKVFLLSHWLTENCPSLIWGGGGGGG